MSGSSAPGAITCRRLSQVRRSVTGSFASAFQKLLTSSTPRDSLISSKTARTSAEASAYSISAMAAAYARFSAARAAWSPHMPWTPPPGGVDDEQR